MKKREPLDIYTDIVANLIEGPKGSTRLAQACNVNYGRVSRFTNALQERGLIRRETREGQEVFVVTEEGVQVYRLWSELRQRLPV